MRIALLFTIFFGLDDIPSTLSDDRFPAGWVASEVAVKSDGTLNGDVLLGHTASLQRWLERGRALFGDVVPGPDDCTVRLVPPSHLSPARSPEELITRSVHIVSGRVMAIRQGFLHGLPGSLLKVTGDYLKGSPSAETYVFYPVAKIRTADGIFCAVPPPGYSPPRLGDTVVYFSPAPIPLSFGGRRVFYDGSLSETLAHIPENGKATLPTALKHLASQENPLDAIVSLIQGGDHCASATTSP
jgi:hypothetical protein